MQQREVSAIHGCSKGKFLHPWMQERDIFVIHGCWKKKFLLSMNAAKGTFCYPCMQQREVSAIHGCRKGCNFCYPWMHRRIVSGIHGCRYLSGKKHVCTHTHLCPDSFVTRLVCTTISTMCEMMRSDVRVVFHIFSIFALH